MWESTHVEGLSEQRVGISEGLRIEGTWSAAALQGRMSIYLRAQNVSFCSWNHLERGEMVAQSWGRFLLGVSSPRACFLDMKSGYKEHQGCLKGKVIKGQATAWGPEVYHVLIGEGVW